MIKPVEITLLYHPNQPVEARIVTLTAQLVDEKIGPWWREVCLKQPLLVRPIDRHWDWNRVEVEMDGELLLHEKFAVVTGEDDDLQVQGGLVISTAPVASELEPGLSCLWLEWLFTAPRNREELRKDQTPYLIGVGTQLLYWAAWFSRENGCDGRLKLESSPNFVKWYERKHLQKVNSKPTVFEDVTYTPMELTTVAAQKLLSIWAAERG